MVGSLTVLPAILSKLGDRVNKGRVPFLRPEQRTGEARAWAWVLDRVLRRPLVSMVVAGAVLVALAIPVFHIHTADSGVDGLPRSLAIMQTYDRMQAAFPGETFSADVVLQGEEPRRRAGARRRRRSCARSRASRISSRSRSRSTCSPDGRSPWSRCRSPAPARTTRSMKAVRRCARTSCRDVFGERVGRRGRRRGRVHRRVGRLQRPEASRIWYVFGFVFAVAFLLLLVTFRSIVIPIKAILLNVLSVAAALGIVTWVFQDGHLESLLGFDSTGAVTAWFPLMLFVILFGLSMDYHVFILSRIKEAVDRGESTEDAVSHGIKSTAGVVSAAALVMVGVFGIFATLSFIDMKQFGVGLAAAVLIDATLVRGVLLPATMKLLGDWNWYLPSWLEWLPKGPALEGERTRAGPRAGSRSGRSCRRRPSRSRTGRGRRA